MPVNIARGGVRAHVVPARVIDILVARPSVPRLELAEYCPSTVARPHLEAARARISTGFDRPDACHV